MSSEGPVYRVRRVFVELLMIEGQFGSTTTFRVLRKYLEVAKAGLQPRSMAVAHPDPLWHINQALQMLDDVVVFTKAEAEKAALQDGVMLSGADALRLADQLDLVDRLLEERRHGRPEFREDEREAERWRAHMVLKLRRQSDD